MNTLTTEKLFIYPPGVLITEKPVLVESSGHINFKNDSKIPLPSLVEAKSNGTEIKIKGLFFVASDFDLREVYINQLFSISNYGCCKLQFFIYCDQETSLEIKSKVNLEKYKAYTFEFKTSNAEAFPEGIKLQNIKVVQTFIWDIDPETSRGTETTVKTSNN